jgi:acyl-coenzyme A synthetase/AMP-(fatty) acid ligase
VDPEVDDVLNVGHRIGTMEVEARGGAPFCRRAAVVGERTSSRGELAAS